MAESGALDEAVRRIGDRWTLLVIDALLDGPAKFGELSERLESIAPNVLTKRLRDLDADGLIRSEPYSTRPPRLQYELTDGGRDLAAALSVLRGWGARQLGVEHRHHRACGTEVELRWWCPTCDRLVDDGEADEDVSV
jgi:DNA-binding HxlR family transcriptional regulator